ncbi:MAG: ABC transporter ATP-binding protein [SAR202 cluster bacterium]|nr:ABC transporter ATP-binding protein [SAR202 cluster bacterium]
MTLPVAIAAQKLIKRYGDLVAVDGIDFEIYRGECFGFLGPNGAGKTSTMRMISCVSPVAGGELFVEGKSVTAEPREVKSILGVVSQADSLDPDLDVFQNLLAFTRYFNLPKKLATERIWEALDLVELRGKASVTPDQLSGGMRRRLHIARAMLHEPGILVLDEPTTGLDPQSRHMVWERLMHLKTRGITILLTTHNMEEAAYLCDRLIVMDHGRILIQGSPRDLVREHAGERVVEVRVGMDRKAGLLESLEGTGLAFEDAGDSVSVFSENGDSRLDGGLLDDYEVVRRPANLEDVFLRLTGRGLRDE